MRIRPTVTKNEIPDNKYERLCILEGTSHSCNITDYGNNKLMHMILFRIQINQQEKLTRNYKLQLLWIFT
jgi:hypothetical protein